MPTTLLRAPHLVAVIVGDDGASSVYVNNKTKAAQKCGITATTKKLGKETTQQELLDLVDSLNKDKEVSNLAQLHSHNRFINNSLTRVPWLSYVFQYSMWIPGKH